MPESEHSSSKLIQSVVRALSIVEALEDNDGMAMTEVAQELDLAQSTAHIYLKTLSESGYVVRKDREYHLGFRFLKHGGYVRHRLKIYQAAKSEVDDLARRTGEVVDFGIEENGKRVLVYKSEGPESVTQKPVTGDYTHMHMTALGKAMLAQHSRDEIGHILENHGLPKATQYTISEREELMSELEQIRERGYSVEDEERREGIRAVGASIDHSDVPSAVSISGPKSRITDQRVNELHEEIRDSINVIQIKIRNY